MAKLTPEEYCKALQNIHRDYTQIRQKAVQSKLTREHLQESLEEFHEPVTSTMQASSDEIETRLQKHTDALEQASQNLQALAQNKVLPISHKPANDSEDEGAVYTPDTSFSDVQPSKKRKLISIQPPPVLSGEIDFDQPTKALMIEDEDFYQDFGLPKLNDIYDIVMQLNDTEDRIKTVKHYRDKLIPVLVKFSQSLAGKKKQSKVWDEDKILKLLEESYRQPDERQMLKERLRLLRKQKFIKEYRNGLRLLEVNINNPSIIQVKYGNGCQLYNSLDDMVERLVLIRGNIEGGNNSFDVINEARAICDQLYKHKAISVDQYRRLYQKFRP